MRNNSWEVKIPSIVCFATQESTKTIVSFQVLNQPHYWWKDFCTCKLMTKKKRPSFEHALCRMNIIQSTVLWVQILKANSTFSTVSVFYRLSEKTSMARILLMKIFNLLQAYRSSQKYQTHLDKTSRPPRYMIHYVFRLEPVHPHQFAERLACRHLLIKQNMNRLW